MGHPTETTRPRRAFAVLLSVVVCGFTCAGHAQLLGGEYPGVLINSIPHVKSKPDFAGEACAEMYLKRLGSTLDQDFVFDKSGVDPSWGRGAEMEELKNALKRIGFVVGTVWHSLSLTQPQDDLQFQFKALHSDLTAGVPSIVQLRDEQHAGQKQFRLLLGYDDHKDEVIYHAPEQKDGAYQRMARETLLKLWPVQHGDDLKVARMPLKATADDLNFIGPTDQISDADYAQHVRVLKKAVPSGFHVYVSKPYVVVGNQHEGVVRKHANETVKWAVDRLKLMYFEKDPEKIVTIWLMKDAKSYNHVIETLYKHKPASKFGYYSPGHRAIFANMSYGTGTLVHEIVHPFMLANFPKCPAWFNEGLASLYEQSNDRDGRMLAQTNQRLKLVQKVIQARQMPPLQNLMSTDRKEFYAGKNRLLHYAQARYLCYYLEKHDLLGAFYHQFRSNHVDDPTGFKTLRKVLGEDGQDMGRFQRKWEHWLLLRRY